MSKFNFLPNQYSNNNKSTINHSYLKEQFKDYNKILKLISKVIKNADFTLGKDVDIFEKNIERLTGAKYAIAVGNGTDALSLSLKALGISHGDEVITTPYTFFATTASIVTCGAKPVFIDVKNDYNINENLIEQKISKKTKAILIVHWSGRPCEMEKIKKIARRNNIKIIQDSCHAIEAKYKNRNLISYGDICTYSMHPLKNLNIWGDGGFITTNDKNISKKIFLIRNHGLKNRNICKEFGFNSRLDTIQAVVANYKIKNKLSNITKKRIQNSKLLDKLLKNIKAVKLVPRYKYLKEVFHLYQINVKNRSMLIKYLHKNSIDAKIHYPIPIHLQPAAKFLKYKKGDFPVCENLAKTTISLPVHEFISKKDIYFVADKIKKFYNLIK